MRINYKNLNLLNVKSRNMILRHKQMTPKLLYLIEQSAL